MAKNDSDLKVLRRLGRVAFGGALAMKSTDVIRHTGSPTALAGDIRGFAGIGVAGGIADISFSLATGKRRRKRKRR